jgi:hypothetical protein
MTVTTDHRGTRVIDLAELGGDGLPAYAAVYGDPGAQAFVLSPAAMRWSDRIWLARLEDCRGFWLMQKKKLRLKLAGLFDPLLRHHYGERYIAVLGCHPWQCLLYLDYQLRHRGRGIYLLQGRLERNIYRRLDWDSWLRPQLVLAEHLGEIGAHGFRGDDFSARQAQLRRFVERIEIATPAAMGTAGPASIRRRFGRWLGLVWHWSFTDSHALNFFPWRQHRPPRVPAVTRDLDYPLNQWACVEILLREDLERLCRQTQNDDCMHVNRMRWKVVLFNGQRIDLDLSFRNPYSLHRDRPAFETALYQARYLYEDRMARLRARDHDLDLSCSMPFIRWRIEIAERITLAPRLLDLFAGEVEEIDFLRIMELQNKLPRAFESYRAEAAFLPERSFSDAVIGESRGANYDPFAWVSGAFSKPLFHCQPAVPMPAPERARKIFLERGSAPWWQAEDAMQSIRDYYIVRDGRGRASWAYRTRDGAWFKQGEFH